MKQRRLCKRCGSYPGTCHEGYECLPDLAVAEERVRSLAAQVYFARVGARAYKELGYKPPALRQRFQILKRIALTDKVLYALAKDQINPKTKVCLTRED